jgi:uncharacterized protein
MNCPVCGRAVDAKYKPFCSRRCSDVDLARWLNGSYAIPVTEEEDDTSSDDAPESPRPH